MVDARQAAEAAARTSYGRLVAILAARNRDAAAPTFPPDGLYFLGPYYDAAHAIPDHPPALDWLP